MEYANALMEKNEIPKALKEEVEVDEAMSRKDALRMAAAKSAFFRKGGKVEKQPPAPSVGSSRYYRGFSVKTPGKAAKEDEKRAKDIAKFRKSKGYEKPSYKLTKGKKKDKKASGYMGLPYGYSPYAKGVKVKKEEHDIQEEIFNWYLIKGNLDKGKIAFVGNEKQVKLKRHDPKFGDGYVMAKSRKDLKIGDAWKKSMGVSEEVGEEDDEEKIKFSDETDKNAENKHDDTLRRQKIIYATEGIEEEVPTVSTAGVAGLDTGLTFKKKKEDEKKAKILRRKLIGEIKMTKFAGKDVFIVDSDIYHACRLGKKKYHRYEKYVGNGKIGQAIREFGLTNPKKPIILQNGEGGPMLYLRYGGSKRYA